MTQRFVRLSLLAAAAFVGSPWVATQAFAQAPAAEAEEANSAVRGSLVEDRAARKLLEAGDARFDADETKEALEIWKSVVERYPKSRLRFQALMRLGNYYLERDRAYDRARAFFESVVIEENQDEEQRAGEADCLKHGEFANAILNRHQSCCADKRQHENHACVGQVAKKPD